LVVVLLVGCSTQFDIVISGLGTAFPIFEFSKTVPAPPRGGGDRIELNSFRVVQRGTLGWDYRNPVWAFETKPGSYIEVGLIKYGAVPAGFTEIAPPKPLSAGIPYRAVAFGAGSGAEKEFALQSIIGDK
jgi:hypothetical protein